MKTKPLDQDLDQSKTWEELLAELRELKVQNAALRSSAAKNAKTDSAGEGNIEEELRRANRALRVLAKCKKAMIQADNEDTLLKKICRIIVKEGGYRLAWIGYIENDEQKTVRPVARAGYDEGYVDKLKIALNHPVRGNGPTGISLKMGKPYRSRNVRTDRDMRPWSEDAIKRGYLSTLNLPIAYEKQVIGALAIYSGDVDAFDREERKLLFELAQTMAYGITAIRDRDRRTKAEDTLRESEERFSYAVKAAQEGIWDWNMETDEVYYSPRYKEMLGYSEDEIEPHASAWLRLMHPGDRERAMSIVNAVVHGEREYEMEFRMLHKDGHYVDILSRGYPIRRKAGGPVTRIVGTHMDITERKRMEEAIRESEARRKVARVVEAERRRLFDVLENLPAMICLLTPDHHIAFANRSFRKKFGEARSGHCYENRFGRTEPCEFCESFKVLETGKPHRWEINSPDGGVIEVYDIPFTDADGSTMILEMDVDITERKRAEEAARASDIRFRSLIQNASDIIRILDRDGRIIYESPSSEKILGYPPGYTLGKSPLDFIHPDDRAMVMSELATVFDSTNMGTPTEFRIRKADGEYLHVESTGKNMIGVPGVDGIVVTTRPITERKNAEKALRESEERFRALADNIPNLSWMANADGWIFWYNKQWYDYTGTTLEEMQGWGWQKVHHPDYVDAVTEEWSASIRLGKPYDNIFPLKGKDGNYRWFLTRVTPIRDEHGNIQRWFGTNTDITERLRLEKELRESEERFKAFMDNSSAIAWMKDAQGRYVYLNETYEEEFGIRAADRLGKTDFEFWPHEVAEEYRKSDLEVIVSGRPKSAIEETPNADGSTSYWFDIKFPFRDASGNIFVGGIGIDITRQKQVEEALKVAKSRNELYVDLMGHDINNINQVAMGYLELAAESLSLGDEDKDLIQKPLEALQGSIKLIENVQKLKKLESGGLRSEVIDLNKVLMETKNQYVHSNGKTVSINYKPHPDCFVVANGLLDDVFSNIIGNAIKHTPRNHVIINIRINTSSQEGKKYYKVSIEDSGPGIPDDVKPKIFNRFERGSTKARGKGLGLYLVKTLVDDFHGKVWAEDRVKGDHTQGTRFIVMLPAYEGDAIGTARSPACIGIVEDDDRIMDLYKKVLIKQGYSVEHTAANGIEAIDMVKNANPGINVIIMDHRLPGMTGLEATREILKIAPGIKIIFASADAGIEEEALDAGALKFLHKPVAPKDIVQAIKDIS